jgi:lipid-A-disaccharide synthase
MSAKVSKRAGPRRVLIIAGEASGDLHGANLVKALHRIAPDVQFYGIGGGELRKAGAELLFHNSQIAVVGIVEVLTKLRSIRRALNQIKESLAEENLDLAILIDFPDFNLHVATHLKRRGVPILYYVSPQIWAWRAWRIRKIKRLVDKMVVILPFEASLYRDHGVDVAFVGHPLLDIVKPRSKPGEFRSHLGVAPGTRIVGLFPGSRDHEVRQLLPIMLRAADDMVHQLPDLCFLVSLAPDIDRQEVHRLLRNHDVSVRIVEKNPYDTMAASDLLIVASGTVTLEAAILTKPMVILYRVSPVTYWIGRMMATVKHIGLVNLVAGRTVATELIQGDASSERIVNEALSILTDQERHSAMISALVDVKEKLGTPGASDRAAHLAREMLGSA